MLHRVLTKHLHYTQHCIRFNGRYISCRFYLFTFLQDSNCGYLIRCKCNSFRAVYFERFLPAA